MLTHLKKEGLTSKKVLEQRKKFGSNELPPPKVEPWYSILLSSLNDKTIWILSAAATISIGISIYSNHNIFEGLGILIAVTIAVGVGFASEFRSTKAFQKLLEENEKLKVKVVRDEKFHTIDIGELVVGDIVLLESGDKVPADGEIIHHLELSFDTSTITGEAASMEASDNLEVYRGYSVLAGEGAMRVTQVGLNTEMGKIQSALTNAPEPTPLQERLAELADQIGLMGTIAAVLIFLALIIRSVMMHHISFFGADFFRIMLNAFIVAVTIVVVAVPEGLPLAVTMSLALNMRRMTKDKNLVRKLAASETMGSATVICSDKTGTLTLNRMRVSALWTPEGGLEPANSKCFLPPYDKLFHALMALNSTAHLEETPGGKIDYTGNPTEGSLLLMLNDKGIDYLEIREKYEVVTRKPFNSSRKMMSSLIKWNEEQALVLVKGAPERILERCNNVSSFLDGEKTDIKEKTSEINDFLDKSAAKGERVLAFAYKLISSNNLDYEEDDLILWGFAVIRDPVRKEVSEAIKQCHQAGIEVKMITGDNPLTAKAISEDLGLIEEGDLILTGNELEKMSDEEIMEKLPKLKILARSRPHDKFRIVSLLKQQNEVVAVTGDGTNDAPALKKADVGIAMGISGTEVAKEASDIILLDDNFKSITKGVLWGRTLYSNIQKFLQFQLTVNVAALSVAFIGALVGGYSPLTAVQLLWVNLIMDTLAAIALGMEPPDPNLMNKKPRKRNAKLITKQMWFMILGMGIYTLISLMILMKWNFLGNGDTHTPEHLSIVFTAFVFIQIFNEINARSLDFTQNPFRNITKSHGFLMIMVLIVIVQFLLTQFGGKLFQTTPLSAFIWLKIILFSSSALIMGAILRTMMKTVFSSK